jgi:phosphoribosylformylglycinamidine synthase
MDVDVANVARREPGMNPVEIMTSESQERMLAIVEPAKLDAVLALARRWEIRASVVGHVTDTAMFRVFDGEELLADVPIGSLGDGPLYHRPTARPAPIEGDPGAALREKFPAGVDLSGELLALLATPTIADKTWVSRQYDHQLFLNTVAGPGSDAAVLRVKGTPKALALSTDGKARFCHLDPRVGAQLAVLEAARNVACVGARPLALVNCLNFGNPEHPEVMWQFGEVVDGMSEACEALGIPVVGGNVSFYNESRGENIHPTPVVGVLGLIDELDGPPPPPALRDGDAIVVIGSVAPELGGSEWAAVVHGLDGGAPPAADLVRARATHEKVAVLDVHGVHDVSDGGLAVALAEMAINGNVGFEVDLSAVGDGTPAEMCFSESASVVVCSADSAIDGGVVIGRAGGDRLIAANAFDVSLADAADAWRNAIPNLMSH